MVLAVVVADQLDTVAARVGLEIGGWGPNVAAAIVDVLGDGVQWDHVGGRAAEQQQSHGTLGGRPPGDGVRLADGDELAEAGLVDRVAGGITNLPSRQSLSRMQALG